MNGEKALEPMARLENRLTELEVKLSFAEDLIETLNETVFRQQRQIEALAKLLLQLRDQAAEPGQSGARDLRDDIPPHY